MHRQLRVPGARLIQALGLAAVLAAPVILTAAPASATSGSVRPPSQGTFPTTIALPNGFSPEGIEIGPGPFAYFGSRVTGSIYRANLATGEGRIISEGPGTQSLGLKTDNRNRLFVAGGNAGNARVIDLRTGAIIARYQFATGPSFVNDVILTRNAAYFTDSTNPVLYKLPLGRRGSLPGPTGFVRIPLTGDIRYATGNNANGIARTPDGRGLLIVQSNLGRLFRVDPDTGVTRRVDLGTTTLTNGDGLLLRGRTLYVVQNRLNQVAVLRLDARATSGELVRVLTDPRFRIPTTVAAYGNRLYLPNARFDVPAGPTVDYDVVAIPRR